MSWAGPPDAPAKTAPIGSGRLPRGCGSIHWTPSFAAAYALTLCAQDFSVSWFKVGGGGGTSSGGGFSISGVAGQHDAGTMTGGPFTLAGGFWSQFVPLPAVGAPLLTISLAPTNTVILSWPAASNGWTLEQNADPASTNWVPASETPLDDGTNRTVVISPLCSALFCRLKQ